MSRPQIGIDRLPARRMSSEPREAMNCKSCRKRKIKCNRLRPSCEACQVFQCPCVYDAVPKKRGPKTDVLEALLKRVDGLEKQLKTSDLPNTPTTPNSEGAVGGDGPTSVPEGEISRPERPVIDIPQNMTCVNGGPQLISPATESASAQTPTLYPELLIDTYFQRVHGKPLYILDEPSTRSRLQNNTLPSSLSFAIYALSAKYAAQFCGYNNAVQAAHDYARRARIELDADEPSIEGLQTLLLLSQVSFQSSKGKKAYMYLSMATSMAFALNLHRELPSALRISHGEREGRRRLFWACYVLDKFAACGSKRPSLIADDSIVLRLPASQMQGGAFVEGEHFPGTSSLQTGKGTTGALAMLIGIVRILGNANRYLAAGGVKGDTRFPWHALSSLSKIRQDLDIWAADTQETFSSVDTLFGQPDSTLLVLSKLIYHLIHCLIYRPFLPLDLTELSATTQHQSWQIESTNICFLHANAIAELVEIGKAASLSDWPGFVGYCVSTAGTIHVHGAHYRGQNGDVFAASADFLSREMQQLAELRYIWAGVQHQRDALHTIYGAHAELVKSLASNPMRFSPVFQLDDFFDRYPGLFVESGHLAFSDFAEDVSGEIMSANHQQGGYRTPSLSTVASYPPQQFYPPGGSLPPTPTTNPRKRRATELSVVSSCSMSGVSPTESFQTPTVPSSAPQHMPFGQIEGFTSDFSFSASSATNGQTATHHSHHTQLPPDATNIYDPAFSIPAAPASVPAVYDPENGVHVDAETVSAAHYHASRHASMSQAHPALMTPDDGSVGGDPDKDPFLTLLEQLAENDQSRTGPSELDFYLGGVSTAA